MTALEDPQVHGEGDPDSILSVRGLNVAFQMDRGVSRVIRDVDIDIHQGEILGVVGESGSGKSMFASALLDAVVDPGTSTGTITYRPPDGEPRDVLSMDKRSLRQLRWEEISIVFQGAMSSFNPTQSIRKHFLETLDEHDHDREVGMRRARELLEALHLRPERVLDSYAHELSGGMKQRALIALSLVLDPEVLVMDEPTSALDLLMQRSILQLLENLQEEYDLTMVFITHDLPLVSNLVDRLAVMYAFQFVEIGPSDEVLLDPIHPYTRALLNSTPNLESPVEVMEPIAGSSPDPVGVPTGCSYHPRCPIATEVCEETDPSIDEAQDGATHHAACWHPAESRELPLSIEGVVGEDEVKSRERDQGAPRPRGESLLSAEGLRVHFEQTRGIFSEPATVRAVDDVSLDIYDRDVLVLVGESGCGKTTLGKALIGLQRPTAGTIRYRGQDFWATRSGESDGEIPYRDMRRALQIIHQDPGSSLNPNRTIKGILTEPLKKWYPSLSTAQRLDAIYGMLETCRMTPAEDYANRYPHQLSGGEKQRIALVRALLVNPDIILADEAVSALDVSLRVEMMDLMLELQEEFGISYIFVSHNLSNARYIASKAGGRIGVMYLGELVELGTPEQIINDPRHPYTQVLQWATPSLTPEETTEGEVPVRSIDIPDPVDPPSGCRFHTRCPEARNVCADQSPDPAAIDGERSVACFREYESDHPYWESDPIEEDETYDEG